MQTSEKVFYTHNDEIYEMLNEYINDETGDHYMVMANASDGTMKKVGLKEFVSDFVVLTSERMMDQSRLKTKYFKTLNKSMRFDFEISSKLSVLKKQLREKYKDIDDEITVGFKR